MTTPPTQPNHKGQTGVLGVVGWPVGHSRSPAMHNAALAALGLDMTYVLFAVPPERLATAIAGAGALGIRGLNITIPHKEAALRLCEPDAIARDVGAVNTLVFDDGVVKGTNTDVHGFRMLMAETGVEPGHHALILGAGGAARAVAMALRTAASGEITVVSRRGQGLPIGNAIIPGIPWSDLPAILPRTHLLIDATPRGLDPDVEPIDLSRLPDDAAVIDLVVRRDTALTVAARARGLNSATGAAMLLHQGAAALERWTGTAAPLEVMRAALEASLT